MAVRQDKQGFQEGVSEFDALIGGVYQQTIYALSDLQAAAAALTQFRGLHVNLRDSTGMEVRLGTNGGTKVFNKVAPTTTAAAILALNSSRKRAGLFNAGTVTVYLGKDNTVTSATGYPLVPGAEMEDAASSDAWWGITASGTGDVRTLEVS